MEAGVPLRSLPAEIQLILLVDAYGVNTVINQVLPHIQDTDDCARLSRIVLQHDGEMWRKSLQVFDGKPVEKNTFTISDGEGGVVVVGRMILSKDGFTPRDENPYHDIPEPFLEAGPPWNVEIGDTPIIPEEEINPRGIKGLIVRLASKLIKKVKT